MSSVGKLIAKSSVLVPADKLNLAVHLLDPNEITTMSVRQAGDLRDLATAVAPNMSKTWYQLADWSFRQAQARSTNPNTTSGLYSLVDDMVPLHTPPSEREFIVSLFSGNLTTTASASAAAAALATTTKTHSLLDSHAIEEIAALVQMKCPSLGDESVRAILDAYEAHLRHAVHLNRVACKAYFSFLKLGDDKVDREF